MLNFFKPTSFRLRIIKVVLLACLAALVLLVVSINAIQSNLTKDKLVKELKVVGQIMGNRSIAALIFFDNQAASINLRTARFHDSIEGLCLYDTDGNYFSSYLKQSNKSLCNDTENTVSQAQLQMDEGSIHWQLPIYDAGEYIGHISVFANTDYLKQSQTSQLIAAGLTLAIAMLIAYLFAVRMLSTTLRPLEDLHETALAVADDSFSKKRAEKHSEDEIGHLVDSFNLMLDNLSYENQALLESESRFRTLAENAPIGIYMKTNEHQKLYVNKRWREITGLSSTCSEDKYVRNIELEHRDIFTNACRRVIRTVSPQVIEYQFNKEKDKQLTLMEYMAPLVDNETNDINGYIGSIVDMTELKSAQIELEKLAYYDPLTNLPNRRFFRDHLHFMLQAVRKNDSGLAVMMLDLDHFKKVNDSLGHDAGDELLIQIAKCIRNSVFEEDVVSRMGGDEFMLLLNNNDGGKTVEAIAERILAAIKQPISLFDHDLQVSASIGIATFPEDASSVEGLIKNADMALYKAKASGRNQFAFFSSELDSALKEAVRIENKLKNALMKNQFQIYIQPQIALADKSVFWGEALIRWIDKDDGFIPPDKFIPVAEESNLIVAIGNWVINEVCEIISTHQADLREIGIQGIAINLSAKQFFSNTLVADIHNIFDIHNIDPSMIEFEITESLVMEDAPKAVEIMRQIRTLGCRLSIDDFGTGYSSLAYLKKFPINSVKIDRSFITGIPADKNDVEISSAILAMAHNLGLEIVAEGVETTEHVDFLAKHRCEYAQGYLFAKPMPVKELLKIECDLYEVAMNQEPA
ncbi:EAL domain-containing protein [Catenovulum sp. SM1970]|uniref:bifunctional diguanylate cyclase/phosphodiesterase n=1 Tax=Marinifaba aquimaris TaxID=2741323 RepID=UPI001571C419|nr:EAL domain-containing protein [Marinifaba aquimaris]NTS78351.1 EAL domain-containing protein [Marinifaba aquimaris]